MKTASKITTKRTKESDVEEFYPFFEKSIRTQFPHYETSLVYDYFLEVGYTKDYLERAVKNKNKFLYIAYFENKIVGYLLSNKNYGGIGLAVKLAVDPLFQKKGIASSLLKLWEMDVIKQGGHKIYLWTVKKNFNFYKKCGFVLGGHIPDFWFGIKNNYLFYKTLARSDEKNFLKEFIKKKRK